VPKGKVFGSTASVAELDWPAYLAQARAVVTHDPPPIEPAKRAGQRVFVTWWSPGHPAVRASGLGPSLVDSVRQAATEVAKSAALPGRIELEIVTETTNGSAHADLKTSPAQVGVYGYAAYDSERYFGWVTPGEIVQDHLVEAHEDHPVKLREWDIFGRLWQRSTVNRNAVDRLAHVKFKTEDRIESATPGAPPVALFRSMPLPATTLSADDLQGSARDAADYIARSCDEQGRFLHEYNPVLDEAAKSYNLLRHAEAVYALMDAYQALRVEAWRAAAERAIAYMGRETKSSADGAWLADGDGKDEQQRAGGAGLALVALARHAEATGDRSHLGAMRELGRFLVHQQQPDGHFRDNADVHDGDAGADASGEKKAESPFFAGEAILGLVRLHGVDPDPRWLEAAKKGAGFILTTRDTGVDARHLVRDHWLTYALVDLFEKTHDARFSEHATKIARSVVGAVILHKSGNERDHNGAMSDRGATAPSAQGLEILGAVLRLSRDTGADAAWLQEPAMQMACFLRAQQLQGEALYLAYAPGKAQGSVRESLLSNEVRIDYVQQALSAWLHLGQELREAPPPRPPPSPGKEGGA
jgi:hypothetical protein